MIALEGVFDGAEADRVLALVSTLPRATRVRVDFHEVEFVDEFALTTFVAEAAAGVELVGLSRHLHRLLRYMGPLPPR